MRAPRILLPLLAVLLSAGPALAIYEAEPRPIAYLGNGFIPFEAFDAEALKDYAIGPVAIYRKPEPNMLLGHFVMWGNRRPKPANTPDFLPAPNGTLTLPDTREIPALLQTASTGYDDPVVLVHEIREGWARTSLGWVVTDKARPVRWKEFFDFTKPEKRDMAVVTRRPAMLRQAPEEDAPAIAGKAWTWGADAPLDLYVQEAQGEWIKVIADHADRMGAMCRDGKEIALKGPAGWVRATRDNAQAAGDPDMYDAPLVLEAHPKGC